MKNSRRKPLQFRESAPDPRRMRRPAILLGLFLLSFLLFYILSNLHTAPVGHDTEGASLPVIFLTCQGRQLDPLYGRRTPETPGSSRPPLFPLPEEEAVPLCVRTQGADVGNIHWELSTVDGGRVLASGALSDPEETGELISGTVSLSGLCVTDTIYLLTIRTEADGADVWYSARVGRLPECYEDRCLELALAFHDAALNGDRDFILPFLETPAGGGADTEDLSHVTITSTATQVCWGASGIQPLSEIAICYTDIRTDATGLELSYLAGRSTAGGTEYYRVLEYFQIRYTPSQFYIETYDREVTQLSATAGLVTEEGVVPLGICPEAPEYLSNDPATLIVWQQAGEIFSYDLATGVRTRIFSFSQDTPADLRTAPDRFDVRLLSMDEGGNVHFAVCGIMPCGDHEGRSGLSLFRYDAGSGVCAERLFLESEDGYPVLGATLSETMYATLGDFYYLQNGSLIRVNLDTLETEYLVRGLLEGQYAFSDSGRYFAYVRDGEVADALYALDLKTGDRQRFSASEGEALMPVAFKEEDLVLGYVRLPDAGRNAAGEQIWPMYKVHILAGIDKTEVRLVYEKDELWVTGAFMEEGRLTLERASRADGIYLPAEQDRLLDTAAASETGARLLQTQDSERGTVWCLQLSTSLPVQPPSFASASWSLLSERHILSLPSPDTSGKAFVYRGSRLSLATTRMASAVRRAELEGGLVVDSRGRTLWSQGRPAYRNAFGGFYVSPSDQEAPRDVQCLSAMLGRENHATDVLAALYEGKSRVEILGEAMPDAAILDLTGCSLRQTFYCIGQANPVYAVTGTEDAVLIIGYTASSVSLYDPVSDSTRVISISEAETIFSASGNVFLSYID